VKKIESSLAIVDTLRFTVALISYFIMSQKLDELYSVRNFANEERNRLTRKLEELTDYHKNMSSTFLQSTYALFTDSDLIDSVVALMRLIMDKISLTREQLNINNGYLGEVNKEIENEQKIVEGLQQTESSSTILKFELPLSEDEIKKFGFFVESPVVGMDELNENIQPNEAKKLIRVYRYCVAQSFITQILDRTDLLADADANKILARLSAESLKY